ncbi:hypothetical protein CPB86DRAFT_783928 [Serendipita vermifera]|nr:hypothetical protein CPB86DRAFT_783928 [Serendipita vermifera]
MRDTKTHVFLVELAHSLLILLSHLPKPLVAGNETWYMMSSCLITLGCCISGKRYDERLVRWAPDHDPAFWIAQVLVSLKPGMSDPTLAFLISALLMGHVRRLYGRNLHCTASTESRSQIREVGDPLLSLIGCLLLGWEYGDFIPLQDDPVWETAAMMVAMDFKNGFGPYMLYRSDADLLLTIASHTNEWVQDRGLWFLTKYSDVSFFANQSDSHARKATTKELLEMALPLFINHPIRQCYQVNLVIKWSFRDRFFGPFLDLGGLVWLSGLMLPWPEECSSCIRFTSPVDGITMLLHHRIQLQELTMEELPEAQAKMLLQSPFLRDTFPDSDAHKYIFMVTTVFEHLKRFGCVDLCFSDVAVKLEEIIGWDEAQRQHCWERSCHELGLIGEGSMQEWMGDLNVLVERLLRGDTEQFRPSRFHYDLTPRKGKLDSLNAQRGKDRLRFHWCSIPHFGRPVVPPLTNSCKHILAAQEYE